MRARDALSLAASFLSRWPSSIVMVWNYEENVRCHCRRKEIHKNRLNMKSRDTYIDSPGKFR